MSDLILLTDAELDLVSGGAVTQTNTSTITQTATATNSGAVTATASGAGSTAAAAGAEAGNDASVTQVNAFVTRSRITL